jgi:hypothetical protein
VTTQPDPTLAPGCFGGALTYNPDATECRSCMFANQCGPLSYEALCRLRKHLGKKPPEPFKQIDADDAIKDSKALAVPRKINDHLERWERRGMAIAPALRAGKNPFSGKKPQWMSVACDALLAFQTGVTREMLTTALASNLQWTQETAAAHARHATQALKALGAIDETNGRITLR